MTDLTTPDSWQAIADLVTWLDKANGTGPEETALRLLKLVEEAGEVAQAYIGTVGQNPRKGVTHTADDVADELCDVILTAAVALHRFTDDPSGHFAEHLRRVAMRSGVATTSPTPGCETCGGPIPTGRTAYCKPGCSLADKDHGSDDEPNGDEL